MLSWIIMLILFFILVLCHFANYTYTARTIKRYKEKNKTTKGFKRNRSKALEDYKKRKAGLIVFNVCLMIIGVLRIATPCMQINAQVKIGSEELKIAYTENDQVKDLDEIFYHDATSGSPESDTDEEPEYYEDEEYQYKQQLHFDLMDNMSYKTYGRKIVGIYSADVNLKDASRSDLEQSLLDTIKQYSSELSELQELRNERELTEEETFKEHQLYMRIYEISPSAEVIYQAGRAAEDAFWIQYNSDRDYRLLLKYAALSIHCFEIFLNYENKIVYAEGVERTVKIEELLFRNGKVYYALIEAAENKNERMHFALCSYGCFSIVTVDITNTNEWSALGYCYLGKSVTKILSDWEVSWPPEEYKQLMQEGSIAVENAIELYQDQNMDYRIEQNTLSELTTLQENYPAFADFVYNTEENSIYMVPVANK